MGDTNAAASTSVKPNCVCRCLSSTIVRGSIVGKGCILQSRKAVHSTGGSGMEYDSVSTGQYLHGHHRTKDDDNQFSVSFQHKWQVSSITSVAKRREQFQISVFFPGFHEKSRERHHFA